MVTSHQGKNHGLVCMIECKVLLQYLHGRWKAKVEELA